MLVGVPLLLPLHHYHLPIPNGLIEKTPLTTVKIAVYEANAANVAVFVLTFALNESNEMNRFVSLLGSCLEFFYCL